MHISVWEFLSMMGVLEGILIGVNSSYLVIKDLWTGRFLASFRIYRLSNGGTQLVSVAYSPNCCSLCCFFWKEFWDIHQRWSCAWMVGEGFNIFLFQFECR